MDNKNKLLTSLLSETLHYAHTSYNIMAGFRSTNIYALNIMAMELKKGPLAAYIKVEGRAKGPRRPLWIYYDHRLDRRDIVEALKSRWRAKPLLCSHCK